MYFEDFRARGLLLAMAPSEIQNADDFLEYARMTPIFRIAPEGLRSRDGGGPRPLLDRRMRRNFHRLATVAFETVRTTVAFETVRS
jgi:hypothetical protein